MLEGWRLLQQGATRAGLALAAPGNLDPSFGDDGLVKLQIGEVGADAFAVLQQTDSLRNSRSSAD